MYPTFSALLNDLFGFNLPLPIQMFGFMVAMAFLFGGYVIKLELLRKKEQGYFVPVIEKHVIGLPATSAELVSNVVIGFITGFKLGFIVSNYQLFVSNPPAFIFSLDGNFLIGLIGAAGLVYYTYQQKNKQKLEKPITKEIEVYPHEQIGTIVIIAAVSGLIGAKIFHNLENLDDFARNPVAALLSFSGLTFYGGLIFGVIAVWYFARKNKMPFIHLLDAAAPGLMLGYGIGRLGCHLSGDGDWGVVNTTFIPDFLPKWFWSYQYPHNVLGEGVPIPGCIGDHCNQLPLGVFPTPLYEAIAALSIFAILWIFRKRFTATGSIFFTYLIINGIERFMIEKIRVNSLYHVGSFAFTQAELISTLLILTGIIGLYFSTKLNGKQS